jgi:hypothetical protein
VIEGGDRVGLESLRERDDRRVGSDAVGEQMGDLSDDKCRDDQSYLEAAAMMARD